ncbi:DUF2079 domain-containing protein [Kibdelosporangium aridum]|uniref:DUF2079 domain-containing protein n=1 Tax=Kibdelosporangium aridum TaxID=2030 RepID=UPI00068BCF17
MPIPQWLTRDPLPRALAAAASASYATHSIRLHRSFQSSGYDLGIFEQIVKSYADGRWPTADLLGPGAPALADHFHPILVVLAPFYLLSPHPETLLVAQSCLFAVSVVPVTRLALRVHGKPVGSVIGIGYAMSWGLWSAVDFDFHEICFAVPLIAFAVERLATQQWKAAAAYALPLLLVKEELALTVMGIGLYLIWRKQRPVGLALTIFSVTSFILVIVVIMPALSTDASYHQIRSLTAPIATPIVAGWDTKLVTVLALLAPTAFVALRSPTVALAIPTLGWRFASGTPTHWGIYAHYSAVLMPIVFVAFVDGLRRLQETRRSIPCAAVVTCLVVTSLTTVMLAIRAPGKPRWTTDQQAAARHALTLVPDGVTVAASNRLAPQLTSRCRVMLYRSEQSTRSQWIVLDRQADTPPTTGYVVIAELPHLAIFTMSASGHTPTGSVWWTKPQVALRKPGTATTPLTGSSPLPGRTRSQARSTTATARETK